MGDLIFGYDPTDHDYIKCHKCGARKTVPQNYPDITSQQWVDDMHLRDCFTIFNQEKRLQK